MAEINLLGREARVFIDRFDGAGTSNLFHLFVRAGKNEHGYVFDVSLAKKLAKVLSQYVEAYEKAVGQVVDDRLDNEGMISPIQPEK